jgi:hypothetical protein
VWLCLHKYACHASSLFAKKATTYTNQRQWCNDTLPKIQKIHNIYSQEINILVKYRLAKSCHLVAKKHKSSTYTSCSCYWNTCSTFYIPYCLTVGFYNSNSLSTANFLMTVLKFPHPQMRPYKLWCGFLSYLFQNPHILLNHQQKVHPADY